MAISPHPKRDALYATLMGEIKVRVQAIYDNLDRVKADRTAPGAFVDIESCFLQVRFICELVALGALLAHEDAGLNSRQLKEWNADAIFGALAKINPHCFPHAIMIAEDTEGRKTITSPPGQFLNRHALQKIYNECGRQLHRGMLKHAAQDFAKNYDVDEMLAWVAELKKLLTDHLVLILPEAQMLLVHMFGGPKGEVEVVRAILPGWSTQ